MNKQIHLIIDGYKCNHKRLNDISYWYKLLNEILPKMLNMQTLGYPIIYNYKNNDPKLDGLTGFQIITTSHISFHTWIKEGTLKMDIFSCVYFDVNKIKDFLEKELDIKLLIFKIIERGDSLEEVKKI